MYIFKAQGIMYTFTQTEEQKCSSIRIYRSDKKKPVAEFTTNKWHTREQAKRIIEDFAA